MSDILKEAIADAKAVRETALQNAKMALEEAFAPKLQSMLSAKLREEDPMDIGHEEDEEEIPAVEMGHEEDDEMEPAPDPALDPVTGEPNVEMGHEEDDEMELDAENMHIGQDEMGHEKDEMGHEPHEENEAPEVIDINGVKYEKMHMEDDEIEMEGIEDPDGSGQEDLDLESIIKELELEINEEDDAYPEDVEGDVNKEQPPEEMGGTAKISEADDAYPEDVEGKEDPEHVGDENTGVGNTPAMVAENDDAEKEEDEDMKEGDEKEEDDSEELKEYKAAVKFLKAKLHEVNILNAKLLFTNKLFKEFALDNSQKLRVVETFDRAQSTREIKLVYATLVESFSDKTVPNRKSKLKESASAKTGSTKRKTEIITEERQVADRFRKLAGIIK